MRGRASEVWLQRFRRAWERRSGRSWRQLSPDEAQALTAQAHSLHQVGFSTDRAAWLAVPRMGEWGFAYPRTNPEEAWHQHQREIYGAKAREMRLAADEAMKAGEFHRAAALRRDQHEYGAMVGAEDTAVWEYTRRRGHAKNPCGGHRRRNPGSELTAWIEGVLANDEASTDEEIVALFMTEGCMSPTEANAWVAKRSQYLAGIVDLLGGGRESFAQYGKRRARRNPDYSKIKGFEPWMAQNPQFCQAVDKFVEFHGVMPQSINKKDMPGMGSPGDKQFLVHMGKAMDTTYKPTHKGSKKYGSAYIHEFGEELGRKPKDADLPDQLCTPDGKNIITFGGRFEVKDWVRK